MLPACQMNLMEEDDDKRKQLSATFNPNFYNPFEIKHRRRTSRGQFKILENAFIDNPKPTAKFRLELAESLSMSPRGVQVWFQNRRAKAKQQQQQKQPKGICVQQCNDNSEDVVESLAVEVPSFELVSSGMVHSRSQSSLSSSTTYSTRNNDSLYTMKADMMQQVIHPSPLLLTPPQQQQQQQQTQPPQQHQGEWWNDIIIDNSHQTFVPAAAQAPSYSLTDTITTASANNKQVSQQDQMEVWAYIDSLDLSNGHTKIDVEGWITSTKEALSDDLFGIMDNRRHSFPSTTPTTPTTHVIQQQQKNQLQIVHWEYQQPHHHHQATHW